MITATPALHLLVALSTAAPAGTTACAADDLHCSAPAFAAKARRAESDAERVEYLYFANRAYLALAEQPPTGHVPSRDLCQAKQLIEQALALPATQLRGRVVESRRETLARLTEHKVRCKKSQPGQKDAPAVALADDARVDADSPAKLLASTPAPSPERSTVPSGEPETAAPPPVVVAEELTQWPVPETAASPTVPMDPPAQRTVSESLTRWDSPPGRPPGRRLLIAGGVSLAAGLALTGVAAYTGAQALGARRTGHESMQLEATPENLTRNMSLEDEYRRLGPVAIVTGVAGGAAVVAAIVMLCVGARRKARAADSEPTLMPVRTGLLFTLKF
jgi:hypothetical protein